MQNLFENLIKKGMIKPATKLSDLFIETEELIAIIGKSIQTASLKQNTQLKIEH